MALATGLIYLTIVVIVRLTKILTYTFIGIIALALVVASVYCVYDRIKERKKNHGKTNQEDSTAKTKQTRKGA